MEIEGTRRCQDKDLFALFAKNFSGPARWEYEELLKPNIASMVNLLNRENSNKRRELKEQIFNHSLVLPDRLYGTLGILFNSWNPGIVSSSDKPSFQHTWIDGVDYCVYKESEIKTEYIEHETVHSLLNFLGHQPNEIHPNALATRPQGIYYGEITSICTDQYAQETELGLMIANIPHPDKVAWRKFRQAFIYEPKPTWEKSVNLAVAIGSKRSGMSKDNYRKMIAPQIQSVVDINWIVR
jgi:hypothetical protein